MIERAVTHTLLLNFFGSAHHLLSLQEPWYDHESSGAKVEAAEL